MKQYGAVENYEAKLKRVMGRFGIDKYDYNFDRHSCWVKFIYKNQLYYLEHSVKNAKAHGQTINLGSDAFSQVVLSLEDLARMVERGIYDLTTYIAGMKYLPPPKEIPRCYLILGFTTMPESVDEVKKKYRERVKIAHPDNGGNAADFEAVKAAYEDAQQLLSGGDSNEEAHDD